MLKNAFMLHGKKRDRSITVEIGQPIWYGIKIPTPCKSFIALFFIPVLSIEAVIKESCYKRITVRKPQTAMPHTFTITLEMQCLKRNCQASSSASYV